MFLGTGVGSATVSTVSISSVAASLSEASISSALVRPESLSSSTVMPSSFPSSVTLSTSSSSPTLTSFPSSATKKYKEETAKIRRSAPTLVTNRLLRAARFFSTSLWAAFALAAAASIPQWGQASALLETFPPHSGHRLIAMPENAPPHSGPQLIRGHRTRKTVFIGSASVAVE